MTRRTPLLAVAFAAAVVGWALWPVPEPTPALAADYDVTASKPDRIAPGTVVAESAPDGWSHLVLKSLPRVRPAEKKKVTDLAARMSAWMFTAVAADVVKSADAPPTFRLRAVGLGLGTAVNGADTVITPETGKKFGADLGFVTRTILTKGYDTQDRATLVVKSPAFAVLDTPVWFKWAGKHTLIRYRYAFLVDEKTGRLDVLLWPLGPDAAHADPAEVVRIAADTVDPVELVADAAEFNVLGVPSDAGFAVDRLPKHAAKTALPADLLPLAAAGKFSAADAQKLEAGLRALLPKLSP